MVDERQGDLFRDLTLGRQLRDDGIADALSDGEQEQWLGRFILAVAEIPSGWVGIGEDIRLAVIPRIGRPRDPHAWGGAMHACVKRGLLVDTGRVEQMAVAKSHARRSPLWRRP